MLSNTECTLLVDLLAKHVLLTPNAYPPVAGLMGDDFAGALDLSKPPKENASLLVTVVRDAGLGAPSRRSSGSSTG